MDDTNTQNTNVDTPQEPVKETPVPEPVTEPVVETPQPVAESPEPVVETPEPVVAEPVVPAPVEPEIKQGEKIWSVEPEEVKTDAGIKAEAEATNAPIEEATVVKDKDFEVDGKPTFIIRSEETGDKVYAVRDGKRYWVRNPESLTKMGFHLGVETRVPFSELLKYPEGEPLDMTPPDAVYPWNKPEVPKSTEPTSPFKVWG